MRTVYRNILVLIAGFCVLHLIFGGKIFLAIALIVLALSAVSEKAAILIEKGWMWIGGTLGTINAAILLFIIYYFLLTGSLLFPVKRRHQSYTRAADEILP